MDVGTAFIRYIISRNGSIEEEADDVFEECTTSQGGEFTLDGNARGKNATAQG